MDNKHYILKDKKIVVVDAIEWANWFTQKNTDRIVGNITIGERRISTVFLGLDHNFTGIGKPILFETMVFSKDDDEVERYETYAQAEAGHKKFVKKYTK